MAELYRECKQLPQRIYASINSNVLEILLGINLLRCEPDIFIKLIETDPDILLQIDESERSMLIMEVR